jgi:hypothetical protein
LGNARAIAIERLEDRRLLAGDLGTIAGNIWLDKNGNGLQDPGESPRGSASLFLDLNGSGTFDSGEPFEVGNATGDYEFANLNPGTYTVRHLIGSDSAFSYPMAASQFNIELNFADDIPENIRAGVHQAAQRWMKIVVGDLPDEGLIDDLQIDVVSGSLADTVLATGGPDQFRSGSNLPYHGVITWAELSLGESTARATEIALHEIAHVLGFGTLWQQQHLIETQIGAPVYTGQAALALYRFAVDSAAKGVPVEPAAGDATTGTHWASSWAAVNDQVFDVMAWKLESTQTERFISIVTVGAIADLGYQVNFAQADLDWPSTKDKYPALRTDAPIGADGKSYTVTVAAGETQGGLDFGVKLSSVTFPSGPKPIITGTLSGSAFIDLNRNGRRERSEKNLTCTIFFDMDRDGVLDASEPRIKITSGSYRFTHIPLGTYRLGVKLPRGIKLATPLKALKMTAANLKQKLNLIGIRP